MVKIISCELNFNAASAMDGDFCDLLSGTVNKDGEDVASVGADLEYRATIKHPSGGIIIIPPRPILHPTTVKSRD